MRVSEEDVHDGQIPYVLIIAGIDPRSDEYTSKESGEVDTEQSMYYYFSDIAQNEESFQKG